MRARGARVAAAMVILLLAADAHAQLIWPLAGQWLPLTVNNGAAVYADVRNDSIGTEAWASPDPEAVDIVGGVDLNLGLYPAGYWAQIGTNLFFRMRVDNPAEYSNNRIYTVLMNTDADDGVDWLLQLDNQFHGRVELAQTLAPEYGPNSSPPWGAINDIQNQATLQIDVGPSNVFSRLLPVDDGSVFHQNTPADQDHFVDLAIPYSMLASYSGLDLQVFRVAMGTSDSHVQMNKDKPDTGWSDVIPEPGTSMLVVAGALLAGVLRRSRPRTEVG